MRKFTIAIFTALVYLSLLTPFWVFRDLLFPFVTSKAFYFRITILLALPFYLYLIIAYKNFRPNLKNPLNLAVLGFLAANLLSAFFGVNVTRSLWGNFERMGGVYYLAHLTALYFYILLLGQLGGGYIKTFLQGFIAVAAVVALNGLSGWLGGPTLTPDPSLPARASSTLGNPIYLGSMVILPLFLCLYFFLQEEIKWKKITYLVLSAVLLAGVYISGTRGALVGLIAGIGLGVLIYLVLTKSRKVKIFGIACLVVFVGLSSAMFIYGDRLPQNAPYRRIFNLKDSNSLARLTQWQTALLGFKDRPVFGTGPENYYIISNSHFNPKMYQYDPSWFDKPHNYLLEILTTTGAVGFVFYAAILLLGLWGLYLGFKSQFFTLLETTVLATGFLAYQAQNLFVFDTVSASLSFFVFLAFIAYVLKESALVTPPNQTKKDKALPNLLLAQSAAGVCLVVVLYALYATDILPMQIAKAVNYGYAYAGVDPKQAALYFKRATTLPFNFDLQETASKYADYALNLPGTELASKDPDFVRREVVEALLYQKQTAERIGNSPIVWDRLAGLQMINALINNQPLDSTIEVSINKAINLVPERIEMMQTLVQFRTLQKRYDEALTVAKQMIAINPRNPNIYWQLAVVQKEAGNTQAAAETVQQALAKGYNFRSFFELSWLLDYYESVHDNVKLISLYEQALQFKPAEAELYVKMANAYLALGKKEQAVELIQNALDKGVKPSQPLRDFLKQIQG